MSSRTASRGMTLIELMIAMLIGLVLILGLVQIFSASRSAYQLSEGLARTQENGRFAIDYLQRDLRMAGHFGCVNDQAHVRQTPSGLTTTFGAAAHPALDFSVSIQGYEASDTAPGDEVELLETPAVGGAAYTPALPAQFAAALGNRVEGSDIVVLRYLAPEGVPITSIAGTPVAPQFGFDAARWSVLQSGVGNPGLFGVADCMSATVFQAAAVNSGGGLVTAGAAPNNAVDFTNVFTSGQAVLYRAESIIYYVGLNGSGRPSLYRLRYTATPNGNLVTDPEELVEGVENMQILYGQDRELAAASAPTGYIDRQGTAADVAASVAPAADGWRRVGTVQLGLVAASPDRAASLQASPDNKLNALGVTFTAPADGRFRSVYQTTVAVRNRLYGN
ncbi:PilW family protein [Xanthomonas sp. H13-6]|uniref:PilW family protein n=1 Tax=Xanthomonas chitinilytica TaxID=2989819 RepID=A0ABT3JRQ5_9XANT|nr:PilW family protein [Xanthomonas sp. H13-6]MCW4471115.1 PilW family protein [Xanthomonas sp. H13-6]